MSRLLLAGLALAAVGGVIAGVVVATRDSGSDTAEVSAAGAATRAWIDHPLEGSEFALGQTIAIRWHASAAGGVGQVEVRANGQRVALDQDFDHSVPMVTQRHEWTPTEPGEYLIEVIATGSGGTGGATAENRVRVVGQDMVARPVTQATPTAIPQERGTPGPSPTGVAAEPTASATTRPASTAVPASATRTPVAAASRTAVAPTRAPTRTPTPLPRTATPVPRTSTPSASPPTHTPTALPDTQGPPAPLVVGPTGGVVLACSQDVILDWQAPTDPSGIASYRARLQVTSGSDWADVKVWDPVTAAQVNANAETTCGGIYRWRVLARDGAGNTGEVSAWAEFSIALP